jgi:hypothetical protein
MVVMSKAGIVFGVKNTASCESTTAFSYGSEHSVGVNKAAINMLS